MTAWLDRLVHGCPRPDGLAAVALAFLAGRDLGAGLCAAWISFPPFCWALPRWCLLLDGADIAKSPCAWRGARCAAGASAFGQFLIGWHWIGYAFLVDPSAHLWQMPFAILVCLTARLGALWRAGLRRWRCCSGRMGSSPAFVFATCYAAAEWLRGMLFTGFPWNLPAYGWGASWAVMQIAVLIGAYGLSFLTILLGACLAEFFTGRWRAPLAMVVLFAALWAYGAYRLANTPSARCSGCTRCGWCNRTFRRRKNMCAA